jgi:hypothetical protein
MFTRRHFARASQIGLLAALILAGAVPGNGQPEPLYLTPGNGPVRTGDGFSLGSDFTTDPSQSLWIYALGILDVSDETWDQSHPIGIWDVTAGNTMIAQGTVNYANTLVLGGFRYVTVNPVLLTPGHEFIIAAYYYPTASSNDHLLDWSSTTPPQVNTLFTNVTGRYTGSNTAGMLTEPMGGVTNRYVGPNFLWTTSDPSVGSATLLTPAESATTVSLTPSLSWTAVADALYYNIYLGTSPSATLVAQSFANSVTLETQREHAVLLVGDCRRVNGGGPSPTLDFTTGDPPPAFFTGEDYLGAGVYYLQFPDTTLFGAYTFATDESLYHYDMGPEAFIPSTNGAIFFFDFTSGHWWYTSPSAFPFLYDFTLSTWIYYFPDTNRPEHYTTNPRYFGNLTTQKVFTM